MSLTPAKIAKQEFTKKFRGYDPAEVKEFQETMAQLFQQVLIENNGLREKLQVYGKKVQEYQQQEKEFREAVVSAQRIGDQIKEKSSQEAAEILAKARDDAKTLREKSEAEAEKTKKQLDSETQAVRQELGAEKQKLVDEIQGLQETRTTVVADLKARLNAYLAALDADDPVGAVAALAEEPLQAAGGAEAGAETVATEDAAVPDTRLSEGDDEELVVAGEGDAVVEEGGVSEDDPGDEPSDAVAWKPPENLEELSEEVDKLSKPPEKGAGHPSAQSGESGDGEGTGGVALGIAGAAAAAAAAVGTSLMDDEESDLSAADGAKEEVEPETKAPGDDAVPEPAPGTEDVPGTDMSATEEQPLTEEKGILEGLSGLDDDDGIEKQTDTLAKGKDQEVSLQDPGEKGILEGLDDAAISPPGSDDENVEASLLAGLDADEPEKEGAGQPPQDENSQADNKNEDEGLLAGLASLEETDSKTPSSDEAGAKAIDDGLTPESLQAENADELEAMSLELDEDTAKEVESLFKDELDDFLGKEKD